MRSARTRIDGGMLTPISRDVLRLTTTSMLGCSIGMSAGFATLRIRSTNVATYRVSLLPVRTVRGDCYPRARNAYGAPGFAQRRTPLLAAHRRTLFPATRSSLDRLAHKQATWKRFGIWPFKALAPPAAKNLSTRRHPALLWPSCASRSRSCNRRNEKG